MSLAALVPVSAMSNEELDAVLRVNGLPAIDHPDPSPLTAPTGSDAVVPFPRRPPRGGAMTDLTDKYGEIRRVLRGRLLWEKACIAQATDLPARGAVWLLALHLEVLRRLENAKAQNDLAALHNHCATALRIVGS